MKGTLRWIAFLFLNFIVAFASAQQVEEFSLIRENAFILNPALTGNKGWLSGTATYRKQFTSIREAPYTAYLGMEGQIADKNVGLGGFFIQDQTGPTGQTGFGVSAAYQIRFNQHELMNEDQVHYNTSTRHMLTIGLGISVMQYRLRADKLNPDVQNDPSLSTLKGAQYFPDASLGIYYQYREFFYAGISVPQLFGLNIKYGATNGYSEIRKVQHLNVLLGGKIPFGEYERVALEPVAALRWVKNAPLQADIGMRLKFLKTFWLGATYRTKSKVLFDAGVEILKIGRVCYSMDFEVSKLRKDAGLSHEVTIAFVIKSAKKYRY
jgi:type IX secretion system PorP/SprF family membrane protein